MEFIGGDFAVFHVGKIMYTIDTIKEEIWAAIEAQDLEVTVSSEDLRTCWALTVQRGQEQLDAQVEAVAAEVLAYRRGIRCYYDAEQAAIQQSGGNPEVVAALGHNTIPFALDEADWHK